jgi:hypothetical protein
MSMNGLDYPAGYDVPENNALPIWKSEAVRYAHEILPSLGWSELRDFSDDKWNSWKKRYDDSVTMYLSFSQSGSLRQTIRLSVHELGGDGRVGYVNLNEDLWNLIKANTHRTLSLLVDEVMMEGR